MFLLRPSFCGTGGVFLFNGLNPSETNDIDNIIVTVISFLIVFFMRILLFLSY